MLYGDKFQNSCTKLARSNWSVLLVGVLIRQIIALCGVVTWMTNGLGYYTESLIVQILIWNNVTFNVTRIEDRSKECMGSWNCGLEILTLIIVILIFLVKYNVIKYLDTLEPETENKVPEGGFTVLIPNNPV